MKKVIFAALFVAVSMSANAQLKVTTSGKVGIATTSPNGYYDATVQQSNNAYHYGGLSIRSSDQTKSMHMGQYPGNAHLGSTTDVIAFYQWYTSYNNVYAQSFNIASDRNIKSNIETIKGGLDKVMSLRSVSYNLNEDLEKGVTKTIYGFISQEVQEILPGLTSEQMDILCMDYLQIIPFLVSGMQEQQVILEAQNDKIDALEEKVSVLNNLLVRLAAFTGMDLNNENVQSAAVLYQNKPNPFRESTTIKYELPETFSSASIMIFDMTGVMLEMYPIGARDGGALMIEGKQLKPGMYLYSLIVDDVEVDTKKMILSK